MKFLIFCPARFYVFLSFLPHCHSTSAKINSFEATGGIRKTEIINSITRIRIRRHSSRRQNKVTKPHNTSKPAPNRNCQKRQKKQQTKQMLGTKWHVSYLSERLLSHSQYFKRRILEGNIWTVHEVEKIQKALWAKWRAVRSWNEWSLKERGDYRRAKGGQTVEEACVGQTFIDFLQLESKYAKNTLEHLSELGNISNKIYYNYFLPIEILYFKYF